MPSCYPYADDVHYELTWTGSAAPSPRAGCTWKAGGGTCRFDPAKELAIALTWPAAGNYYQLTVALAGDEHRRSFSPAPPAAQVAVTVLP